MKKPWQKLKSKIVHKNPYYNVREDEVIRPDGKLGKYYVVGIKDGVKVIAEAADGGIFLVGQSRYPINNIYSWEVAGGAIENKFTPLATAKKELKEETGFRAKKWFSLGYFYVQSGINSSKCFIFLAKELIKGEAEPEGTEDITVKKFKLAKILEMIGHSRLADSHTIASISKYLIYKNRIKI